MSVPVHNKSTKPHVFYLCNGEDTHCAKTNCVYSGGECKYTTNIEYADNFTKYTPTDACGSKKIAFFENEKYFAGGITRATDAAQPVIIGVDLAKGADYTALAPSPSDKGGGK